MDKNGVTFKPSPHLDKPKKKEEDPTSRPRRKRRRIRLRQMEDEFDQAPMRFTDLDHGCGSVASAMNCDKVEATFTDHASDEIKKIPILEQSFQMHHGFIRAAEIAWKSHFPLKIDPIHIWLLILQAVAMHVDKHSQLLRNKWVNFDGRKKLVVNRDDFVKGKLFVCWIFVLFIIVRVCFVVVCFVFLWLFCTLCYPCAQTVFFCLMFLLGLRARNNWSEVVVSFCEQIDQHTAKDSVSLLEANFSNATIIDKIAAKITIMDICKSYFEFVVRTRCGFPRITLTGTKGDWIKIYQKTEKLLKDKVEPQWGKQWSQAVLPILQRYVFFFCFDSQHCQNC